jgi:uncharacterized membrane protein
MLLLLACASEPAPGPGSDTAAACTPDPDYTWETFGAAFVAGRCQGCHGSGSTARYGAPESLTFDDEAEVRVLREAVLRTVLTDTTMPPGGGLTDTEKERLGRWLACP